MGEIRTIPPRLTRDEWNALLDHSLVKAASYIIRRNGDYTEAINGSTGKIDYSGTDAGTVIQSAINALAGKGRIFIKAGLYEVDGIYVENPISITDDSVSQHIILEGEGKFNTFINLKNNANGAISKDTGFTERGVILAEPKNGTDTTGIRITIRNLGINGNRTNQTRDICGIIVRGGRQSTVENCYVYYASRFGIMFQTPFISRENHIRGNTVYSTWNYNQSAPPSPVENNLAGIASFLDDVTIEDNVIGWTGSGESRGVGIRFATSNTIMRNWLWGHRHAIVGSSAQDSQVSDNFVEQNREIGIWLTNCQNVQVLNNRVRMGLDGVNPSCGIRLYGSCQRVSIRNNMIWANSDYTLGYGIYEGETPSDNLIECNSLLQSPGIITTPISVINAKVRFNKGYVTENSGTATIAAGTTSVVVAHGLSGTPRVVKHCPRANLGAVWVSARDGTNITLNVATAPSVDTITDWEAEL